MNAHPDLLILRLRALGLDVEKVKVAVTHANKRGELLEKARRAINECPGKLRWVQGHQEALLQATDVVPDLVELLAVARPFFDDDLRRAPRLVTDLMGAVDRAIDSLNKAMETAVPLADHSQSLEKSLRQRCDAVTGEIGTLQTRVEIENEARRREHWTAYQDLLDNKARPIFIEYVDFLGGVAMRDTGLDDRVCEMTDVLLTRFNGMPRQSSLPLPARQAALGNALESVVLLGFPEWSIWGIPLVAHEVGLGYAKDRNDDRLLALVRRYVRDGKNTPPAERVTTEYVHQLIADAFAAYTLGLGYACAALLLRLNPKHDEELSSTDPRDIDRARVIKMALASGAALGGSFSDDLDRLWKIWETAVVVHAGPAQQAAALNEAQGPPPEVDWLDNFSRDVVELFDGDNTIRRFDTDRWRGSGEWKDAIAQGGVGPSWNPENDTVAEVLTAAWRLRLDGAPPDELAGKVKQRWSERLKGGLR